MKENINYLICIVGATGVGKSALAIELAKYFKTAVVSSDSRQIYREMDIGTNKILPSEMANIPHYLLDIVNPNEDYDVAQFEKDALNLLEKLYKETNVVILAGGTGFYIDAIIKGMNSLPIVSKEIRKLVQDDLNIKGIEYLLSELKEKDFICWEQIDRKNPRRITRAIEVLRSSALPFSSFKNKDSINRDFEVILIGLELETSLLNTKINERVIKMLKMGLINEVKALLSKGYDANLNAMQTIGYKETIAFLNNELTENELITQIQNHTRQYAKRQRTWFKKDTSIKWFHPAEANLIIQHIESQIKTLR